jgi:hypothetical protein
MLTSEIGTYDFPTRNSLERRRVVKSESIRRAMCDLQERIYIPLIGFYEKGSDRYSNDRRQETRLDRKTE